MREHVHRLCYDQLVQDDSGCCEEQSRLLSAQVRAAMQRMLESDECSELAFDLRCDSCAVHDSGDFAWLRDEDVAFFFVEKSVLHDQLRDLCCLKNIFS